MKIVLLTLLLFITAPAGAQPVSPESEEKFTPHAVPAASFSNNDQPLSSGFSGTGDNIDVLYHRVHWQVDPTNTNNILTGTVTTCFKTIQPLVENISFDFSKAAFDNVSLIVQYHGNNCNTSFPSAGNTNVLNITLPSTIVNMGSIDSVTIRYSGVPVTDGLGGGFSFRTYANQFGATERYAITLSESYEDRNWWPCKADMQDKIDSMDISITVPWINSDTFWVASNGILTDSAINGSQRTFSYKTRYPIASYLVGMAAAKYNRYYSSVAVGNRTVPVYWYLLANRPAAYYSDALDAMAKMNPVVQAFSNLTGEYPFKDEKHGYYDGLVGASGMEHQTFSCIAPGSLTSLATLAHELMHQWFGDNVTFGTWNDLWLAEGFATYGELLAAEFVPSLGYSAYIRRRGKQSNALSITNTSLWIPNSNIVSSNAIWNTSYGSAVYQRGCMVVSMLRSICGDEKFFEALHDYQTLLKNRSASTDSLKYIFNHVLNTDLSDFFDDYVGGSGYGATPVGGKGNPVYEIKWNSPSANTLVVGVQSQSTAGGSNVDYFNGPVVIRAKGSNVAEDTTITFYDFGNGDLGSAGNGRGAPVSGNALTYSLSFTPVEMFYDDSARTLSTGSMIQDPSFEGYTWYGTADSNWYNALNWASCCGVPPAGADVTIATINHAPLLTSSALVHDINFKSGNFISLDSHTLTISGAIKGNGTFKGSATSNIIITGKAGNIHFSQGIAGDNTLQSLILQEGAGLTIANDATIHTLIVNPSATLSISNAVKLVTY